MDAAHRALELVAGGNVVGPGSGSAATALIQALGKRVSEGLRVRGIATSEASARLAERLHVPLAAPEEAEAIDVAFDGADEVDPHGDLIKGHGGALIREKIVAALRGHRRSREARRRARPPWPVSRGGDALRAGTGPPPARAGLPGHAAPRRGIADRDRQRQSRSRLPHDPDRGSTGSRFRDPRDPGGAGNGALPRHSRYDTGRGRRRRRSARDESATMGAEAIAPPARWAGLVGARKE